MELRNSKQEVFRSMNIWGLTGIEEIYIDDKLFWKIPIDNPFFENGRYKVGLNQKLFREAWKKGVDKFILKVGEREIAMNVAPERALKDKDKMGEYEDRPSLFKGSDPMRIYHFQV